MAKPRTETRGMTFQVKTEYKKRIDRAARDLSDELDRRVYSTEIFYTLMDKYLNDAIEHIRKK